MRGMKDVLNGTLGTAFGIILARVAWVLITGEIR